MSERIIGRTVEAEIKKVAETGHYLCVFEEAGKKRVGFLPIDNVPKDNEPKKEKEKDTKGKRHHKRKSDVDTNIGKKVWATIIGETFNSVDNKTQVVYTLARGRKQLPYVLASVCSPIADGDIQIKGFVYEGCGIKAAITSNAYTDPIPVLTAAIRTAETYNFNKVVHQNIDFIIWDDDITTYIRNAINTVHLSQINVNMVERTAHVECQRQDVFKILGRKGTNLALIQKLVGYKIILDVKSSYFPELGEKLPSACMHDLLMEGIKTTEELADIVNAGNPEGRIPEKTFQIIKELFDFEFQDEEEEDEGKDGYINVTCPDCGAEFEMPDNVLAFKCPKCGHRLEVMED